LLVRSSTLGKNGMGNKKKRGISFYMKSGKARAAYSGGGQSQSLRQRKKNATIPTGRGGGGSLQCHCLSVKRRKEPSVGYLKPSLPRDDVRGCNTRNASWGRSGLKGLYQGNQNANRSPITCLTMREREIWENL